MGTIEDTRISWKLHELEKERITDITSFLGSPKGKGGASNKVVVNGLRGYGQIFAYNIAGLLVRHDYSVMQAPVLSVLSISGKTEIYGMQRDLVNDMSMLFFVYNRRSETPDGGFYDAPWMFARKLRWLEEGRERKDRAKTVKSRRSSVVVVNDTVDDESKITFLSPEDIYRYRFTEVLEGKTDGDKVPMVFEDFDYLTKREIGAVGEEAKDFLCDGGCIVELSSDGAYRATGLGCYLLERGGHPRYVQFHDGLTRDELEEKFDGRNLLVVDDSDSNGSGLEVFTDLGAREARSFHEMYRSIRGE